MAFDEEHLDDHGECKKEIDRLQASEELAWGLIANAYGGDWDLASEASGWKAAAELWRDKYHDNLPLIPGDAKRPTTPVAIVEHAPKYIAGAWRDYPLEELGQWIHLLHKRARHRTSMSKRLKDLQNARNYWMMMGAWLEAADDDDIMPDVFEKGSGI